MKQERCHNFFLSFPVVIQIIATAVLTLHPYADCRSYQTTNLNASNSGNGTQLRISRQNKGENFNGKVESQKLMCFHLGIESNSIQRLVGARPSFSSKSNSQFSKSAKLKRVFLSNREITCNDGSQAGFYLRKSPGSRRWVVFFEGGWHCYDHKSCKMRWTKMR